MKNYRIWTTWTLIVVVMVMFVFVESSKAQPTKKEVFKGRFSYHWFPTHACAINCEKFAKLVREKTKGQVEITTYGSAQLYSLQEIVTALSTGAVDIGGFLDTSFASVDPNIGFCMLPYYWGGYEQIRRFWEETPAGRQHWEGLQAKLNIKVLAYIPTGSVMLYSTKKPLPTPADVRGLKARYLSKAEIPVYEALGATPVFVQTTEIYTALQTGMVDIVPTVLNAIKAYSWWEFLKFGNKPYMYFWDSYIVVNRTWWNKLPEDIRNTIVKEVCVPLSNEATKEVMTISEQIIEEWQRDRGGKVVLLTKEQQEAYKNIFRTKVWPAQVAKFDPAVIAEAEKITGTPTK